MNVSDFSVWGTGYCFVSSYCLVILLPTKLEKALEQFYLINSRKLYMILQVFACCWPFLRSKPWIHCCWAQTNRMILCNQYFTPWRGNQMVINYLLNIAMMVHFENTSVTVRIWVCEVEEREWTFMVLVTESEF